MGEERRIETFREFWPYYLAEHSRPMTKALHLAGTVLGTGAFLWAVASRDWRFVPAGLLVGYGFAWVSHFFIERNRPATFKYPLWSFISDYRMAAMMLTSVKSWKP